MLSFYKYQGLGNHFVIMAAKDCPKNTSFSQWAQSLCDPHFGIGADGLIIYFEHPTAHAEMKIWNSDGSQPEMCGNGLRCFVHYLYDVQNIKKEGFQIETGAGRLSAKFNPETQETCVNMGSPILETSQIPALGFKGSPVISEPLILDGFPPFLVSLVSMGNPHCIVFVDALNDIPFDIWGPALEKHSAFPKHANIEFVEIASSQEAHVKVWERGVGATLACGTGACAVLMAGVLNKKLETQAQIKLPGGPLEIQWLESSNQILMTGPSKRVFEGKLHLEDILDDPITS